MCKIPANTIEQRTTGRPIGAAIVPIIPKSIGKSVFANVNIEELAEIKED
jgi:hypothetical protein